MAVLNQSGHLELGDLSPTKPYLYFMVVMIISVFMGIWGFFVYIDIAKRNGLLAGYQYRKKGALLKIIIILVNVQGRNAVLPVLQYIMNGPSMIMREKERYYYKAPDPGGGLGGFVDYNFIVPLSWQRSWATLWKGKNKFGNILTPL